MAHPRNPAGAAQPTPQQRDRISFPRSFRDPRPVKMVYLPLSAQLRALNVACKAAVAANGKAQGALTHGPKPERHDDRGSHSWPLPLSAAATTAVNVGSCCACRTCESAYNGTAFLPAARVRSGWRGYSSWICLGRARGGERRRLS